MVNRERQHWHCLRLIVPHAGAEDLSAHCFEQGSCGLQIEEEEDRARLIVYFDAALDLGSILRELERYLEARELVGVEVVTECLEEQDWEVEWRRFFGPVWATPRIVVHPSWVPVDVGEDQIAVVIDPEMAFGTGGHESTQLCLQALEAVVQPGDCCLDLGTGSGILAITAVRLGAGHVLAVDLDPRAVENARQNLERNGIATGRVAVRQGSIDSLSDERFDTILANIQSSVLEPMLRSFRGLLRERGRAIFSGLLATEEREFCSRVEAAGLRVEAVPAKNNWICVVARKG